MKSLKSTNLIAFILVFVLLLGVTVSANAEGSVIKLKDEAWSEDIKEDSTEDEIAEEIYNKTGMRLTAKVGVITYAESTIINNDDISEEIHHRTGMRLTARVGKVIYKKPTVNNSVELFAVNPPTSEAPRYPYSANWSNTKNFTYTSYYFSEGDFDADADGPFDAEFYYNDGTYGGTISAEYVNGGYQVRAFTTGMSYYYVVLVNNSSSSAKNATYVAY